MAKDEVGYSAGMECGIYEGVEVGRTAHGRPEFQIWNFKLLTIYYSLSEDMNILCKMESLNFKVTENCKRATSATMNY